MGELVRVQRHIQLKADLSGKLGPAQLPVGLGVDLRAGPVCRGVQAVRRGAEQLQRNIAGFIGHKPIRGFRHVHALVIAIIDQLGRMNRTPHGNVDFQGCFPLGNRRRAKIPALPVKLIDRLRLVVGRNAHGKCKAIQCTAQQISGGAGAFGEQRASRKRTAVEIQTVHRVQERFSGWIGKGEGGVQGAPVVEKLIQNEHAQIRGRTFIRHLNPLCHISGSCCIAVELARDPRLHQRVG